MEEVELKQLTMNYWTLMYTQVASYLCAQILKNLFITVHMRNTRIVIDVLLSILVDKSEVQVNTKIHGICAPVIHLPFTCHSQ